MGAVKVIDKAQVLILQKIGFRQGGAHDVALFDDLVGQGPGMDRQLFVGSEKFAAFLFQKAFCRKPCASFPKQTFRNIHSLPTTIPSPPGARARGPKVRFSRLASLIGMNQSLRWTGPAMLAMRWLGMRQFGNPSGRRI
jgi:hypothetical protein